MVISKLRNGKVWTWICAPGQNYVCKFLNFIKIVKQLLDFSDDKNSELQFHDQLK